jgi:hypothetical protein
VTSVEQGVIDGVAHCWMEVERSSLVDYNCMDTFDDRNIPWPKHVGDFCRSVSKKRPVPPWFVPQGWGPCGGGRAKGTLGQATLQHFNVTDLLERQFKGKVLFLVGDSTNQGLFCGLLCGFRRYGFPALPPPSAHQMGIKLKWEHPSHDVLAAQVASTLVVFIASTHFVDDWRRIVQPPQNFKAVVLFEARAIHYKSNEICADITKRSLCEIQPHTLAGREAHSIQRLGDKSKEGYLMFPVGLSQKAGYILNQSNFEAASRNALNLIREWNNAGNQTFGVNMEVLASHFAVQGSNGKSSGLYEDYVSGPFKGEDICHKFTGKPDEGIPWQVSIARNLSRDIGVPLLPLNRQHLQRWEMHPHRPKRPDCMHVAFGPGTYDLELKLLSSLECMSPAFFKPGENPDSAAVVLQANRRARSRLASP